MHSSLSDQLESVNASVEMGRLLTRFADEGPAILRYDAHPLAPQGPTINARAGRPGRQRAGRGAGLGVVSVRHSRAAGDGARGVLADLEAFLARVAEEQPGLKATVTDEAWLPACEIAPTHPVVEALAEASAEVLGASPPFAVFPGGTDAPHFQLAAGVPTVPSCGPGLLTAAHRPNESITLQSIAEATAIYASAAKRFLALS